MTRPDPATASAYNRIITVATAVIAAAQLMVGTVCLAAFYSVQLTSAQHTALALSAGACFLLGFFFLYVSVIFDRDDRGQSC